MKHYLLAGLVSALLIVAGPADARKQQQASNIDFGAITCAEFISEVGRASEDDIGAMFLWLDGYLSGLSGDTVLRFDGLEQFATNLTEHCGRRGRDKLLDAARKVGIQ